MKLPSISRRAILGVGAVAVARSQAPTSALTAAALIERIKKEVGVPWRTETVDKIVSGNANTPVKGVATTMMATLDVVQRAAAEGKNFVITHEPTFYSHLDSTDPLAQDPVYEFKADFLRKHDMVIFRFHDHWHARRPDGIATGMAQALGWEKYVDAQKSVRLYQLPSTPLSKLVKDMEASLGAKTIRVVGDPKLQVRSVMGTWGYNNLMPAAKILNRDDVDVLLIGEAREWELIEYAADLVTMGKKKALIVLGHIASEQSGMKYCADWLKSFVTEVPVGYVPAAEPFWKPA